MSKHVIPHEQDFYYTHKMKTLDITSIEFYSQKKERDWNPLTMPSYFRLVLPAFLDSTFFFAASNSSSVGSEGPSPPPYLEAIDEKKESNCSFLWFRRWEMIAYKSSESFFDLQKDFLHG